MLERAIRYARNHAQALAAVQANERRFRALIEHGSDGISCVAWPGSLDSLCEPVYHPCPRLYPGEFARYDLMELIHPDDRADVRHRITAGHAVGGMTQNYEVRLLHKDGTYRWLEYTGTILLEDPTVAGIVVNYRDITERKRDEEWRALLIAVVESSADAIIGETLTGTVLSWNPGAERLYGYTAAEMIGQKKAILLHPDRTDELTKVMARVARGERVTDYETKRVCKDGSIRDVSINVAIHNAHGAIIAASTITHDITARMRAEAQLRENEERHRMVLAALDEGVILQGADGTILTANASAERIFGVAEAQLFGRVNTDVAWEMFYEDGIPVPMEEYPADIARRTGEPQTNIIMGKRGTKGTITWLSVNAHPLFHQGETQAHAVVVSFRDVTERKRAEEQLRHAALHDPMTGLANRALFVDHLQQALARNQRTQERGFAVLFLDLDRFKSINDEFGHLAGDALLVEIARRLQACVRAVDTVARFGGDEFAILLEDPGAFRDVERVAERIRLAMRTPFRIVQQEMTMTVSMGITAGAPHYPPGRGCAA